MLRPPKNMWSNRKFLATKLAGFPGRSLLPSQLYLMSLVPLAPFPSS